MRHMLDFAWWRDNDIVVKYFYSESLILCWWCLMFEVTYNVVLLVLVFLFAWKGKCRCNTEFRHTFLLAWWGGKKACTLNIFSWKDPLCLYCVLCWHPVWLNVRKVRKKKKNYMMTNISCYNKWLPPCIGQWQGSYFDYMTICLELTTFM